MKPKNPALHNTSPDFQWEKKNLSKQTHIKVNV